MSLEIKIANFPYQYGAWFQCIGGDNPVQGAYYYMANWLKKEGIDYKNRLIGGFDYPNQNWMPPPHGCVGLLFIEESEVDNGKFRGVHVHKFDTSGKYATINENCHISEAWELMNALRDKGEYTFDTEKGRQYFEMHFFGDENFNHDEKLKFNIWMPIKKV